MRRFAKPDHLVGAFLFVLTMAVYAMTTSPTISFWDCAEFIATAHTLGIPHQPGTPLYVLVGHVFSLLPLGLGVAHKINLMSGFFSALAVTFMYLAAVRLQYTWREDEAAGAPSWIPRAGAACGALFFAFSTTFWNNATEATAAFTDAGCTIGQTWDTTGIKLHIDVDKKWIYTSPKEGALAWMDTMAIPSGAANVEHAY